MVNEVGEIAHGDQRPAGGQGGDVSSRQRPNFSLDHVRIEFKLLK
jgi:hypothetical protein